MVDSGVVTDSSTPQDMVGKALSLLTRLGDYPDGVVASELAREARFPLSTAHRLLGALVRDGYARFDPRTKQYTLGLRIFQLVHSVSHAHAMAGMVQRILQEVSLATQEATLVAVRDGNRQLYLHSIGGPQQVGVIGETGRHGPLHCTSQGKVLVAFSPPAVGDHLIETLHLDKCGPNSITDRARFRDEIAAVRACGYATADEEHEAGIRAISVPIFWRHDTVAALATAAPAYRVDLEQLVEHVPMLNQAAETLAAVMPLA